MTAKHGREAFRKDQVGQILPFWRRVTDSALDDFLHLVGYPAALKRAIATGRLSPKPLKAPPDTFWTRSVVAWHSWMESFPTSSCSLPYALDYRKPGANHSMDADCLPVAEVAQLIREETIDRFNCDISDINGLSASKSHDSDIVDIDEFPHKACVELVEPVSAEHLQENMRHRGLFLDRMRFADYPWTERRIYWLNEDGSHHLAAARYQARRLCTQVPLTGTLYRYHVNGQMIVALRNKWNMFLIPDKDLFGSFFDAMKDFGCPFGNGELPHNMHDDTKISEKLCVIWLERGARKPDAVARVLTLAGFPDFGLQLESLARRTGAFSR
ncbi:DUF6685 family protein [Cedecea sp. P7760]|uniref:DUF6685 family protein n=1 Tax=Cedecea sp. P7760 TaxID=2726983 RepID=UPI0021059388|nr:DUF6685 family protein [Cedecea sp. P7760]